jgi:NADH-quinone oxidoreductase subunit A
MLSRLETARASLVERAPSMLQQYAPILIFVVMVAVFALANLALSDLLGKKRRSIGKADVYESGMEPVGSARVRLSIHFYLIAVLFILFDVESIFLIPWAVASKSLAAAGVGRIVFAEIAVFAGVLGLGLAYVWRKGGLEWDR